jgi:transcriptional regulator with XRE-family HTH domain
MLDRKISRCAQTSIRRSGLSEPRSARFANKNPLYAMEDMMSTIANKVAKHVGAAVRARRQELKLPLRALGSRSGISASMISDIERGAKSPTVATLAVLAAALEVSISSLVDAAMPTSGRIRVVRSSERLPVIDPATGATRQNFGPAIRGSKVEFLRYLVPPRTITGPFAAHAKGTIEHVHLAAGTLAISVGGETVRLEAGDSCSCYTDASHFFDNANGDVEALVYLVVERR